jgi:hypothetical protein
MIQILTAKNESLRRLIMFGQYCDCVPAGFLSRKAICHDSATLLNLCDWTLLAVLPFSYLTI